MSNPTTFPRTESRLLLNAVTTQFKEVAHKATDIKQVINNCLSANVYAHPTLLNDVDKNIKELKSLIDNVENPHQYNIMLCVCEVIDKNIKGSENGKKIFSDSVNVLYGMNTFDIFNTSGIEKKLCSLLKYHKVNLSEPDRISKDQTLLKYKTVLEAIEGSYSFLSNLIDHESIQSNEMYDEIIDGIKSYIGDEQETPLEVS